jgi:hypothetical protein
MENARKDIGSTESSGQISPLAALIASNNEVIAYYSSSEYRQKQAEHRRRAAHGLAALHRAQRTIGSAATQQPLVRIQFGSVDFRIG